MEDLSTIYIKERVKMLKLCSRHHIQEADANDFINESFVELCERTNAINSYDKCAIYIEDRFISLWWKELSNQISKSKYERKRQKIAKQMLDTDNNFDSELVEDENGTLSTEPLATDNVHRDAADRELEDELLVAALKLLPEHLARPVFLKYVKHLSNKEIAVRLQLSDKTVQKYLSQGLKKLDPNEKVYRNKRYGRKRQS